MHPSTLFRQVHRSILLIEAPKKGVLPYLQAAHHHLTILAP